MHVQLSRKKGLSQEGLDKFLHKGVVSKEELPKGVHEKTLNQVYHYLTTIDEAASAENIAAQVGLARVTTGRYLNYLESIDKIKMTLSYGTIGRPIQLYQVFARDGGV